MNKCQPEAQAGCVVFSLELLLRSAQKLIWAFEGLKETGTDYGSILDYNTQEVISLQEVISRVYVQH